jgi:hypothetical protein
VLGAVQRSPVPPDHSDSALCNLVNNKPRLLDGQNIYIHGNTQPIPDDLERIILDCGGEVVGAFRDCSMVISSTGANRLKQTDPPKPVVAVAVCRSTNNTHTHTHTERERERERDICQAINVRAQQCYW